MASVLSAAHFHNEEAAYAFVEARLWPDGPICPRCGATEEHVGRLNGKSTRAGLHKCYACRQPFTVKIGTIFESSHLPLNMWLQAIHLMCSSKKGISTRQLQRTLGVGMKTAWFLGHRIREAMKGPQSSGPLGGAGKAVEADETFIGTKKGRKVMRGHGHKRAVLSLVERGGSVRSFHIERANSNNVRAVLTDQVDRESVIMTDEAAYYRWVASEFADHHSVNHSAEEYVRPQVSFRDCKFVVDSVHTNTLEGFFSVFKRGMVGIYQHCGEQHLKRYLAEFDFRYNHRAKLGIDDEERAERALVGAKGKRLTYRTTRGEVTA